MDNEMKSLILGFVLVTLGGAMLTGCKAVPRAYRGSYEDAASGVRLRLKANRGTFVTADGRALSMKTEPLKFENLAKGEAGIYVERFESGGDVAQAEVNWIVPDPGSRKEEAGMVWFDSEVIFARLDLSGRGKAEGLELMHCARGQVTLDMVSKTWQVGCPEGEKQYRLTRIKVLTERNNKEPRTPRPRPSGTRTRGF